MYVLSSHLLELACGARDRAIATAQKNPRAMASDATIAIILSAAGTEGFINELPECILNLSRKFSAQYKVSPQYTAFADVMKELEEGRAGPKAKYKAASWLLSGNRFDEGQNPFQDFAWLIKLRDAHMHLKFNDPFDLKDGRFVHTTPKDVQTLQQRGLARNCEIDPNSFISWLQALQTAGVATWQGNRTSKLCWAKGLHC